MDQRPRQATASARHEARATPADYAPGISPRAASGPGQDRGNPVYMPVSVGTQREGREAKIVNRSDSAGHSVSNCENTNINKYNIFYIN